MQFSTGFLPVSYWGPRLATGGPGEGSDQATGWGPGAGLWAQGVGAKDHCNEDLGQSVSQLFGFKTVAKSVSNRLVLNCRLRSPPGVDPFSWKLVKNWIACQGRWW